MAEFWQSYLIITRAEEMAVSGLLWLSISSWIYGKVGQNAKSGSGRYSYPFDKVKAEGLLMLEMKAKPSPVLSKHTFL